ncbi:MAG: sigma-70 family RNA polymerase sigma factor [Bacteroidales bacterium]|nr:sigma-70 family RNA polymerase sigma factor [Bacteroidales bacterium]MDD4216050.1 sigma-70 family RNA polymerase sigma factor [Bacteroidales bacterium]MDY0140536.1 sigma-70 family RNA polymerase sigma factor [Bacteroidales bacterium]
MSAQDFNTRLMTYENSLSYFALSLTRDPDTAKDLVQDTYLKAIQYRDKYTLDNNIKAWLFTILRNTYLNQVTRLSYKNTIKDDSDDSYIIKNTLPENENAESIINTDEITSEINALNKEYRIPFQMFLDGFKYKEIAEEIDLPIGTVKSRIFFARKILMERLHEFA